MITFKGESYLVDEFENAVDIFDLSNEEIEEYFTLLPKYHLFETGGKTWNGDDVWRKSVDKILIDNRYLDKIQKEVLESRNLSHLII